MPFDVSQVDTDPVVLALVRAKARIVDPKNWCTGHVARTASGKSAWPTDAGAVQFCAYGAVIAEQDGKLSGLPHDCLQLACAELHGHAFYTKVNNKLGHEAVMTLFDHAISKARALSLHSPSGRGEG